MAASQPPQRRQSSLLHKLAALQRCGRAPSPLFSTALRLTPIESALDEASDLKSAVLLGFTRDGNHLVSYTTQPVAAADGQDGYCLQLWRFAPGARCRKLWSVPLFRVQPYLDALTDEDGFMAADDMLLTVAEAPDSSMLVVHGRAADPADGACQYLSLIPGPLHAGAAQLQVCHLSYATAFPHFPFNPYLFLTPVDTGGTSSSSSSSSSSPEPSGTLAVALYTGGSVSYLHAAVGRQPVQSVPAAPSAASPMATAAEEGEEDSSTSNFPSPDGPAVMAAEAEAHSPALLPAGQRASLQPPAAAVEASSPQRHQQRQGTPTRSRWPPAEQQGAASPAGSPWPRQRRHTPQRPPPSPAVEGGPDGELDVQRALVSCAHAMGRGGSSWQPWASGSTCDTSGRGCAAVSCTAAPGTQLDIEACVFAALQQQGVPPAALLDYAAAPVQACTWRGREGLLLLAVLRLARDQPHLQQDANQQLPQQQGATRSACVLLHAAATGDDSEQQAAGGSSDSAAAAAAIVEWLEPPYPWHDDLSAFLVQQTAFAGLAFEKAPAFFADFMRARWSAPPPRCRLPLVLSNRSVLGSGQSLAHIAHPWQPVALLGYGSGGAQAGV